MGRQFRGKFLGLKLKRVTVTRIIKPAYGAHVSRVVKFLNTRFIHDAKSVY